MNKERELLRKALVYLSGLPARSYIHDDIEAYLSTTSDDAEEPVAWMFQHEDTGLIDFVDTQQVEWGFEKNNPRWQKIGPVFLHPPKPAEPEAETIETLKAENFALASGQCTEGGPWGDEGGTPYCKYVEPARKPIEHQIVLEKAISLKFRTPDPMSAFFSGVNFAERHHGIGGSDE